MAETIIYIRTSTEEQNPENQLKDCVSINQYGEHQLIEDRQSAWKEHSERDGFESLKKLIGQKKVKHLIVWDLDRLYRNRKNLVDFFKFCEIHKCKIHSYRQEWLDKINDMPSPWNEIIHDLMIQVMGWLAQDESDKKSQRIRSAIRMQEDGAYSYRGRKWGRRRISAQAINKILELRKQGKTIREICEEVKHVDKGNLKNVSAGLVHKIISGQYTKKKL